MTTKYVGKISL